jgi:aromatic-L-amino-acid decarboxylase
MDPARRLQLSCEDMRELGYRVVDILVAHHENLRDKPVTRIADWKASREKLGQPFAEEGDSIAAVLWQLQHDIFGTIMHVNHPRFFAFVPGPGNFVGAMADALAAGFNVFTGTWMEGSGAATVELITVDWLRRICGLPDTAQGLFVSGGSVANLTALAVARHVKLNDDMRGAIVYYSDQTHSSLERGLRLLGIPAQQTRRLGSDEHFRLPVASVEHQVNADRGAGLKPFCVIANGGTTNGRGRSARRSRGLLPPGRTLAPL